MSPTRTVSPKHINTMQHTAFKETIWAYYGAHGRHDLPWRQARNDGSFDPYAIMVSELMLQQTQVNRVTPKFQHFMAQFPTVAQLAAAPLADVLQAWSGLGYNRRAKFLWQAAHQIMQDHHGQVPLDAAALVRLPGIGPNTAGALIAYAANRPVVFVETNIRTVFIYHFFADHAERVTDTALAALVQATLPEDTIREWYWALMDYGTHLKQTVGNVGRQSTSYTKQSKFEGSRRQVRGQVLKHLGGGPQTLAQLRQYISDERLPAVLADLQAEGFIHQKQTQYCLGSAC